MSKRKNQLLFFMVVAVLFLLINLYFYQKNNNSSDSDNERGYGLHDLPKKSEYLSEDYILGGYLQDSIFNDVKYFPLAAIQGAEEFYFEQSFGLARTYGGDRKHEGTDIMTPDNIRGTCPVISVCNGTVTNIGWLELGGYRVGVLSEQGVYYYYAHLYRYDTMIAEGSRVSAGQILGYAGDSGYGAEGTTGQFDVHLHFGIYLNDEEGNEVALDPYPLLKNLRNKMLRFFD
jgi:Membrane proteins related to metalloendopeptidases